MKKIVKEINSKNNLNKNLNEYIKKMVDLYNRNSSVRLSMNYYLYYQMLFESKSNHTELIGLADELDTIINEFVVLDNCDLEINIDKANKIRNKIFKVTELLTEYTDIFSVYEYLLNRVEYRFKELPENLININKIEDENVARDMRAYEDG